MQSALARVTSVILFPLHANIAMFTDSKFCALFSSSVIPRCHYTKEKLQFSNSKVHLIIVVHTNISIARRLQDL